MSTTYIKPENLTVIKGLICLGVTGLHLIPGPINESTNYYIQLSVWTYSRVRIGYEGFFVLAGYFLAYGFRPIRAQIFSVPKYLTRRIIKLALPYWAALVGVGAAGFFISARISGRDYELSIPDLLAQFFFIHDVMGATLTSYAFWFMAPLMQYYVLWSACFWLIRRYYLHQSASDIHTKTLRRMIAVTFVIWCASMIVVVARISTNWNLPYNACFITLGSFYYWKQSKYSPTLVLAIIVISMIVCGISLSLHKLITATVIVLILIAFADKSMNDTWLTRCLQYIGTRSYSLYLTHTFIGLRTNNYLIRQFDDPPLSILLIIWLMSIAFCVAFADLFYRVVEYPSIKLAALIRYR